MSRTSEILRRIEEQKKIEQLRRQTQPVSDSLSELYKRHRYLTFGIKSRCNGDMGGPFLIAPNDKYRLSRKKVAFVGQQTGGWLSSDNIDEQIGEYRDFNLGINYRSTPFWYIIHELERRLIGSLYSSAWLNLNRYDQDSKTPSLNNLEILKELDWLLLEELRLIEPHIVIFFTGPELEHRILKLLGVEATAKTTVIDRLFKITSPKLNSLIFSTDHPKYLRLSHTEQSVINAICAEVARHPPW